MDQDRAERRRQILERLGGQARTAEDGGRELSGRETIGVIIGFVWVIGSLATLNSHTSSPLYWALLAVGGLLIWFGFGATPRYLVVTGVGLALATTTAVALSALWKPLGCAAMLLLVLVAVIAGAVVQTRQTEHMLIRNLDLGKLDRWAALEKDIAAERPFGVYLRAFQEESPDPIYDYDVPESPPVVIGYRVDETQDRIRDHLSGLQVYAVRDPMHLARHTVFDTVLAVGDDWPQDVAEVLQHARLIVVHYSLITEGLEAECAMVAEDPALCAKCWLIVDPRCRALGRHGRRLAERARWCAPPRPDASPPTWPSREELFGGVT